jgi:serine/threonine protein kinase
VHEGALPGYRIGDQVGRGTWGVVTHAVDAQGRPVVVKQLDDAFAADPEVRRRFAAQAPALVSLDHPHVVPVLAQTDVDGECLLVMDRLDGGTLRTRARGGLSPEVACALVLAASGGVDRAHQVGVLHRDLKPENLLFTATGVLKVGDFGLAEIVSGSRTLATRDGRVLGAPDYMAPEQVRTENPVPATDVYALATILYELLAGRLPFPAGSDGLATMALHVQEEPADLAAVAPGTPASLVAVVMRGLAAELTARHATADEFGAALADAAARAWGPGWLRRTGITVTASGAVTERLHATRALEAAAPPPPPPPPPPPAPPVVAETMAPTPRAAPVVGPAETMAAPAMAQAPPSPPQPPAPATPPPPGSTGGDRTAKVVFAVLAVVAVAGVAAFLALRPSGGGSPKKVASTTVAPTTVVTIGPKVVDVDGRVPFTDTGVDVKTGDDVLVTATGSVFPAIPDRNMVAGPDGVPNRPDLKQFNVVGNVDHSGLIGRIGPAGSVFAVGHRYRVTAVDGGRLFLGVNDTGLENNDGAFQATVTVTRH